MTSSSENETDRLLEGVITRLDVNSEVIRALGGAIKDEAEATRANTEIKERVLAAVEAERVDLQEQRDILQAQRDLLQEQRDQQKWEIWGWRIVAGMVLLSLLGLGFIAHDNHGQGQLLIECTTPKQVKTPPPGTPPPAPDLDRCYERGQAQTAKVVGDLPTGAATAAWCALQFLRLEDVQDCVRDHAPQPTPVPVPAPPITPTPSPAAVDGISALDP